MSHIDELKALVAKWEAEEKAEKASYIEPCPICGGEMVEGSDGHPAHVKEWCGYSWGMPVESYNAIARVLRDTLDFAHTGHVGSLPDAIHDFEALRTKAREGMKWATSNIKEAKEGM